MTDFDAPTLVVQVTPPLSQRLQIALTVILFVVFLGLVSLVPEPKAVECVGASATAEER